MIYLSALKNDEIRPNCSSSSNNNNNNSNNNSNWSKKWKLDSLDRPLKSHIKTRYDGVTHNSSLIYWRDSWPGFLGSISHVQGSTGILLLTFSGILKHWLDIERRLVIDFSGDCIGWIWFVDCRSWFLEIPLWILHDGFHFHFGLVLDWFQRSPSILLRRLSIFINRVLCVPFGSLRDWLGINQNCWLIALFKDRPINRRFLVDIWWVGSQRFRDWLEDSTRLLRPDSPENPAGRFSGNPIR